MPRRLPQNLGRPLEPGELERISRVSALAQRIAQLMYGPETAPLMISRGRYARALAMPAPGWPKKLPCIQCDRPRLAEHAGDRMHARCGNPEVGPDDGRRKRGPAFDCPRCGKPCHNMQHLSLGLRRA
jgi:hypothetical protein